MMEQDEETKDSLRREQNQAKALHRNLNLLIVDILILTDGAQPWSEQPGLARLSPAYPAQGQQQGDIEL